MHKCPDAREMQLYVKADKTRLYFYGCLSLAVLTVGMFLFIRGNPDIGIIFAPFAIMTVSYLLVSYFIGIFGKEFDYKKHLKTVGILNPESFTEAERPTIDIFYAVCGEPLDIQENSLHYIVDLQKRWGINCNIYVLDDSKDGSSLAAFKRMRLRTLNIHYLRRDDIGVLKKAGNLRHAFAKTNGEFIAVFDADFCPAPNFFEQTVPYMIKDEKIGIVQTPQYFNLEDCKNWVDKGAAYVQELFYRLIQVNRDYYDGSICVGTNALYRRTALVPFGGSADIPYSEDVRTGLRITSIGYKVRYLPLILAKGLCPDNLPGFILQQHRWALGSISLAFGKEFWVTKLTFMQRLCYMSGQFYYITTGLGLLFVNIPSIYLLTFHPSKILIFNAMFSVPSFLFGTIYQAKWSKAQWGLYAMKIRTAAYHSHLFALLEFITGNLTPWQATGVATKTKLYERFQNFIFYTTSVFYIITLICVAKNYEVYGIINFIPTLFFATLNYYIGITILKDQI